MAPMNQEGLQSHAASRCLRPPQRGVGGPVAMLSAAQRYSFICLPLDVRIIARNLLSVKHVRSHGTAIAKSGPVCRCEPPKAAWQPPGSLGIAAPRKTRLAM